MTQQLGLFDAPSEQEQPQTFEAWAHEYQQQAILATSEADRDAYQHLMSHALRTFPVNAIVRSIYLCTKIIYRGYGERREQRALYLQEFPRFLAVQQIDPHPVAIETMLEAVFVEGRRDGAFLYCDGDPVLVWRNNEDEPFVVSHLLSDSHEAVSSLDEVEITGEWIAC